jgi:hypothetical protein
VPQHPLTTITEEENSKPIDVRGHYADIWRVLQEQIDFK